MTKKIFKSIMLVSAIVMALGLAFVMGILYRYFEGRITVELVQEAAYLEAGVEKMGLEYLETFQENTSRITYVDKEGKVLFDNKADEATMENHGHREEVQEAMAHGHGMSTRMSKTLSEKTFYYAVRLTDGAVLRVSSTQESVFALLTELILPVFWILLLMLVLSGIFAARISKNVVRPINELDLDHPEENEAYAEVSPLLSRIYKQKKEIAAQLKKAQKQQEEFSIITENMQEGLLVVDKYTMILSGNSSVARLLNVSRVNVGECVYSMNRSEEFRDVVGKALEGRHAATVLKLNGTCIQVVANPVLGEGETEGAVLLLVDVTESLEREALRREFSANVSHELKTPLTSISGFAEIIEDGYVQPEDVKKFAGRIYKEASRLIQLVEDTIKISQLDEGAVPYERERADLYQLSKGVLDCLGETARQKHVQLYIDGGHVSCETVPRILQEVLLNLCENAIKYNREEGRVCIHLAETEQQVQITVEDTGIGIPAEEQSRVFERFYRVDKSHSKEIGGTGLGLSIVKHGVAFLKGELTLRSQVGEGTSISITFPK